MFTYFIFNLLIAYDSENLTLHNRSLHTHKKHRQTISPGQSASYHAATDDTPAKRGDSDLERLNTSVSVHTTTQKSSSHPCVRVYVHVFIQPLLGH